MTTQSSRPLAPHVIRKAVWTAVVAIALLAAPTVALAQTTTIIGSLANFDAVNDTEGEKSGFEIQLEGIQVNDITRVFGQNGAQCWIRYCIGSITPYTDAATGKSGVYVRWMANYDAASHTFVVPAQNPNAGSTTSGTPSRVGMVNPPRLVSGEQCWTLGLAATYPSSGCEHFGISTAFGKNPTKTTYRWLVGNPADGSIAPATINVQVPGVPAPLQIQAPPVAIPQPVAVAAVKNNVVQLDVVIPAMAPVADPPPPPGQPVPLPHRYGKAQWVKVYKTELGRDAALDELVGGHPNHVIEDAEAGPVETEWKLLQMDVTNPDNGSSQLQNSGKHGSGKRAVVRRYEFYKYSGPVTAPGTRADKQGVAYLGDDGEVSNCTRINGECSGPPQVLDPALFQDTDYVDPKTGFHFAEVGDYSGAQMAADNLVDARLVPVIDWAPAAIGYGSPLGAAQLTASASATGHPSVPGTFEFTPALGAILAAGTHTLQVVFTPADAATYTTQSMTRQITINKATLTVKADPQSKVYGAPDPAFTFTATGFLNGDTAATALSGELGRAIGSNVGKYAINIGTLTTSSNYSGSFTGALLDITPAPLSIAANDATKIYGQTTTFAGSEFTVGAGQLQGADAVASVTLTSAGADAAAPAGSSPIVASAAVGSGLANYTIGYVDGTLTIVKAPSTVTVTCPASVTFTGVAQTPCTAEANSAGMAAVDVTASLTYAGNSDAGAAVVSANWAGDGNHAASAGSGGFAIAAAASTLTVSCPASATFTGAAIEPCTAAVSGAGGLNVSVAPTYSNNVNVGTATAVASYPGDLNHLGSSNSSTFVINAAAPPPPSGISINPIPSRSDRLGAEVEFRAVVTGAGRGGRFSATGLPNGIRINDEGEIHGHVGGPAGSTTVTITFIKQDVTVSTTFVWQVTQPVPGSGRDSDDKDGNDTDR